ncbi:MAG: DUF4276 family protein [Chromatiaceae bacterium]|nr:MAG: DUF4276 family protein [Chromatiaceae bacterium]
MKASHLEVLVEEPSMEAFLRALLPRLLTRDRTFEVHAFQGKNDLLGKLEARLRGYAAWLPAVWRILVVVDRDDEDCRDLKQRLEITAHQAGLRSRSLAGGRPWQLVNRIAIEELEAWYFGDWSAVRIAYPRLPSTVTNQHRYRDPDAIAGGTWEAFERILQRRGYFKGGLRKIEAARTLGGVVEPGRHCSQSFCRFRDALLEAVA